jgi:hypothetical protein
MAVTVKAQVPISTVTKTFQSGQIIYLNVFLFPDNKCIFATQFDYVWYERAMFSVLKAIKFEYTFILLATGVDHAVAQVFSH